MSSSVNPKTAGLFSEKDYEKLIANVTKVINESNGILTPVAKKIGLTREQVETMIAEVPDLAAAVMDQRKSWVDLAFAKLLQAINAGQPWAIKYMLDMAAKDAAVSTKSES